MLDTLLSSAQNEAQVPGKIYLEEIDQELNSIFGTSKTLSSTQQVEINIIKKEIDKIYIKNSSEQVEKIYTQMDAIYKSDTITKEQEQNLSNLERALNELFISSSSTDITPEDDKVLTILNAEIDALYDTKLPSLKDLERAEVLLKERMSLSSPTLNHSGLSLSYSA